MQSPWLAVIPDLCSVFLNGLSYHKLKCNIQLRRFFLSSRHWGQEVVEAFTTPCRASPARSQSALDFRFCFVLSQLADTVNAPSYFHPLHCSPCEFPQLAMQLNIYAGRSAFRTTTSRSLSHSCRRVVSWCISQPVPQLRPFRIVRCTLIDQEGSMAVAIVPRTFLADCLFIIVSASCPFLRCLRFSGRRTWECKWSCPVLWHITCHNYLAEPK